MKLRNRILFPHRHPFVTWYVTLQNKPNGHPEHHLSKKQKSKKSTHGEGLKRSWTGDMVYFFCFLVFCFSIGFGHFWAKVAKTS